ncbi:transcription factor SOX-30-like [Cyclopterus lumpus]|uniref:transcription factor SOX-30-like n=1 Tax=Cyclopterus lumpus TaxID=8103 RepID=UPI0014875AEF|nr:transcription factor SOX-30-like [Cyclopterus lumpus]
MPLKKRKRDPGGFSQTGAAGHRVTRKGSNTCKGHAASVGASSAFEDGRSPPISTLFNNVSAKGGGGNGGVRSGGGGRSQVSAGKLLHCEEQIAERLHTPQGAAREPLNPDPVRLTTSPVLGGDRPVSSFTIPPTEKDLEQLQSGQDKNGHIKCSPNAYIVWGHIHRRYARRKISPGANMIETGIVLACEWSKLSQEQKRPYYEVAHKLKCMQKQQFHDYVLCRQKKKDRECLSSGQGAEQDPGISFSQAVPPAQSNLKGPMYPYPPIMPYGQPTFYPVSSNLCSRVRNKHLRYQQSQHSPQRDESYAAGHQAAATGHQQSGV